ncbi:hypothetical protein CAPTEDRAFT_195270 [Capitella teleta]|uniref:Neurotransmitter-gated ion-channel ligand-binding domain-containing protein n=1 Tax=Capitella teleta TaxID=283909 RepID=R7TN55_CAPTE|nr:hypothetical protein CAPTEDRAFT_195270 [Capitella teleta]|eukprot:ELT94957.1 hypothetical protein CAPTEDRAFT_195270 [Capitella teleta]
MTYVCVALLFLIQATYSYSEPCVLNGETCLMKHLKTNIEVNSLNVRPAFNGSDTTHLKFGIAITGIVKLKHNGNNDSELTLSCWFRYAWNDPRLSWNPEDFGGVTDIRIPTKYIWKPDIVLVNSLDLHDQMYEEALAVLYSDGSVRWVPNGRMTVQAYDKKTSVNWRGVKFYTASFRFDSLTYDGFKLALSLTEDDEETDFADTRGDQSVTNLGNNHAHSVAIGDWVKSRLQRLLLRHIWTSPIGNHPSAISWYSQVFERRGGFVKSCNGHFVTPKREAGKWVCV